MTKDGLTHTLVRRLAFVKYLYQLGIGQSRSPEPFAAAALLTFHDAIELFLQLASEYCNVGKGHPAFLEYWDFINPKLEGGELAQKESMRRLNKARVALKHHGTLPSKLDLEAFRAATVGFFADNTPLVFGVELAEVSMVEFVQPEKARNHLAMAQQATKESELEVARENVALAFYFMVSDYEDRKRYGFYRSPFDFGEGTGLRSSFSLGLNRAARFSYSRSGGEVEKRLNELEGNLAGICRPGKEVSRVNAASDAGNGFRN